MAVTMTFYNSYMLKLVNGGGIDLDTDDVFVSLHTSSYTPNRDSHDFFDDATNEVSGGTYVSGGYQLTVTATQDNDNNKAVVDASDVELTSATVPTCRYAVIRKKLSTAGTSPLICYIDFGEDKAVTSGTFTLGFNVGGLFTVGQGA